MNPYTTANTMSNPELLQTVYIKMKQKVILLKEINNKKKRGKLPLPLLKEKADISSNLLEVLNILISNVDMKVDGSNDYIDIMNDLGLILGRANILDDNSNENYQLIIDILDGFLS
jgi:hypothetical protein